MFTDYQPVFKRSNSIFNLMEGLLKSNYIKSNNIYVNVVIIKILFYRRKTFTRPKYF